MFASTLTIFIKMKIISAFMLFIILLTIEISAQIKKQQLILSNSKLTNYSSSKYFDVNHSYIFEYGLLLNLTDKGAASTVSSSYDFNLTSKKLYGSVQGGAFFVHAEGESGAGFLFGFGFDYSVYIENNYNFSVYIGAQGLLFGIPAAFGVVHLRNSIITDDNGAFTFGIRYLQRIGMNEHWLMPALGYQLLLK